MDKDYTNYKVDQLLNDDYFLMSERRPTPESDAFWVMQEKHAPQLTPEIDLARRAIKALKTPIGRLSEKDMDLLWSRIIKENVHQDKKHKHTIIMRWAAAACIAVLFTGSWLFIQFVKVPEELTTSIEFVKSPDKCVSDIQLILSGEKEVIIDGNDSHVQYERDGQVHVNSEAVAKVSDESEQGEYNQLIVPFGKSSSITFSDGTKVWVNSGTRLVYPAVFMKERREIYVEGEIYLEVTHEENRPFIVKTDCMQVRVLGTRFNVNAYASDEAQEVVLVSGKVQVETQKKEKTILKPNQLLSYKGDKAQLRTINALEYISWKDGTYQYHQERLDKVFKQLSRYYGKEIDCGKGVENLTCTGKLDLKSNISIVLDVLEKTAAIEVIETNEKIYINVKP